MVGLLIWALQFFLIMDGKFIGDFHIHSHFSLATSKELVPEYLDYWARVKGIKVVGTGDFTHPKWIKELKEKLEPAEQGLYKLKKEYKLNHAIHGFIPVEQDVRFILTAEISNIYKKNGAVRKVHNVLFAPDFDVVDQVQHQLNARKFNITSDGRPILGLDAKDLLDLSLNVSEKIFFVPAHIWTPWFSVLGAKSGFNTIDECFEDLSNHIHAVETGLSSDPSMNWVCSFLDKYTLIANSDAHSPEKLGRNANVFETEISYEHIIWAMKTGDPDHFKGTIDFFPQEGKYYYDGHRKCNIQWDPLKTLENKGICPVCGRKVTVGVMHRVAELADRGIPSQLDERAPFYPLIPLKEILSEIFKTGPNTLRVAKEYSRLLNKAGSEFNILLNNSIDTIATYQNDVLTEAIGRMRNRNVIIKEGYDGAYGAIHVFDDDENFTTSNQDSLFIDQCNNSKKQEPRPLISFDLGKFRELKNSGISLIEENKSKT